MSSELGDASSCYTRSDSKQRMGVSCGIVVLAPRSDGRSAKTLDMSLRCRYGAKNIIKTVTYIGFARFKGASAVRAILQHTPEKPSRRSAASHLSIALSEACEVILKSI